MLAGRIRMGTYRENKKIPGSDILIAGTMQEGFFGEVTAAQLITGDTLANKVGILQGTSQFPLGNWLKFAYKGKIQFIAKKPIRYGTSWSSINSAGCVYGDKVITIKGFEYKVRLIRGANKIPTTIYDGEILHYSEWNRLMLRVHEESVNKNWGYPNNVESDINPFSHNLGSGVNGMYRDNDLCINSGNGFSGHCQEIVRGNGSVSKSERANPYGTNWYDGWRPVLELVA